MLRRLSFILFALSAISTFMVLVQYIVDGAPTSIVFLRNLLLCWIPYFISYILWIYHTNFRLLNKWFLFLLWGCWFLFYPNVPNMLTDCIDLDWQMLMSTDSNSIITREQILYWYKFIFISIGIWTSFLLDAISLYLLQWIITERKGGRSGWTFVVIVQILSGMVIYMGRWIGIHSWDLIVQPVFVIQTLLPKFTGHMFFLSFIFALLSMCTYIATYGFLRTRQC